MLRVNTILAVGFPSEKIELIYFECKTFFVDFGPNNPIKTNVLNIFVEHVIIHIIYGIDGK
jgi:hypothetical protein